VVNPLHEEFTWLAGRNLRVTLVLLFGAVSCLLAIACLNVANLLLGRSIVRRREIAIRSALGSSWVRVLRQLTTETLLLTACGAVCGVGLAAAGLRYLRVVNPIQLPPGADITISAPVIAFTAALAIAVGLIVGLAPMWRASGAHLGAPLSSGGRAGVAPSAQRFGRLLVVVQAALSVVLLVGAALLIQSESRFAAVPLDRSRQHLQLPPRSTGRSSVADSRAVTAVSSIACSGTAVGEVALSTCPRAGWCRRYWSGAAAGSSACHLQHRAAVDLDRYSRSCAFTPTAGVLGPADSRGPRGAS
jgi:putative ABC transport system permease protein